MKNTLGLIVILSIATACQTIVDFEIPMANPKLVVNSLFTPDSVWQIRVSWSKHILASEYSGFQIGDAVVTIRDENNLLIETITSSTDKFFRYQYFGKTKPLPDKAYTIQVDASNGTRVQSIGKAPTVVPITSVEIDSTKYKSLGEPVEMTVNFNDPVSEKNYYMIKFTQDVISHWTNLDTIWTTVESYIEIDAQSLSSNFNEPVRFINDNLFNGKSYNLHVKVSGGWRLSKNPKLILLNISEEYYKYFISKNVQQSAAGDPFAQPAQVFNNIENGLGIFAGYSASVVELK